MHCNLSPPDTMPVFTCFNYDTRAKSEVAFFSADTYTVTLTFDPVTFTFDLEHL